MPNVICLGELLIDFCAADADGCGGRAVSGQTVAAAVDRDRTAPNGKPISPILS
jgi:hypothetical protein